MILATLASLAAGAGVFYSFNRALSGVEAAYRRQHELEHRLLTISDEHQRIVQLEKLSAMGTMVGEIAHQLNNPLVGVVNMAQLAERSVDKPERVREMLGEIRKAGQNCSAFVKRMLDFTKVSCFDSRPTDLRSVADEALGLFNQSIGRRATVVRDMPEAPAIAVVDPNLLGHAIFNLLTNAAQATGERGHVRIALTRAAHADGRPGWRFTVEDDGPGISDDAMRRLFTPFFTTRKEGTGLGLAVVQHIVLLHEGEVGAANRGQGGASLALWLPEGSTSAPRAPDGTPA
jgi:signal transduction histidine kinase